MKITELKTKQGNPRLIKDDKFLKLVNSIKEFPKMLELRPIIYDPTTMEILGGNMRYNALKELKYKEIPDNWIKAASELTDDEKKRFLITDNVGFGEWDWDILANEWDVKELEEWGLDLRGFDVSSEQYGEDFSLKDGDKAPFQQMTFTLAAVLYNSDRYKELIKEIEESSIDNDVKDLLKVAASRHIVFNYENMADFYANSDKEVQTLMENSALVIIDFNRAIELGYVKLREEIAAQYGQDYGYDE